MPMCCAAAGLPSTCSCGRIVIDPDCDDEVVAMFSKYQTGVARRLKKPEALAMLMNEFALNEIEAQIFFQIFDKDQNEVLSLWEFRQFNQTVGTKANEMIQLFHKLEEPATGYVDIGKTFDALTHVDSGKGKLTEDEIVTFLQTTAGDSKTIDLHKFLNMMSRIKVYTGGV